MVDRVFNAGGNPCPLWCWELGSEELRYCGGKRQKRYWGIGNRHPEKHVVDFEEEIKRICNETGVGPMGLGGITTVLEAKH